MATKKKAVSKKPPAPKKTVAAKAVPNIRSGPRRLRPPRYRGFSLKKRIVPVAKLPSAWKLTKKAAALLWKHRKTILIITLIYGFLNILLVRGLTGGTDVSALKADFNQVFSGTWAHVATSVSIFALLVSSAGNSSSAVAGAYQVILLVIVSLAVVWILRQLLAGEKVRVRDGFYKGMYPLIPCALVLGVIAIQLIPLLIGTSLYSLVINDGIAIYPFEKLSWGVLCFALALLSIYLVCSSLFALYIVLLPDMTPMKALRSARELVRHRRWMIIRKILFLPLVLLIVAGIIMVPIIAIAPPLAQWVFFLLTMLALPVVHGYMYSLYRELL